MSGRSSTRVLPSHLAYLRDFNLVEERRGDVRLFPHTEQLPAIFKAIQNEFLTGLSARMANTDQRADDFRKFTLSFVVKCFCLQFNSIGEDTLLVLPYFSRDGVAGLSVAQHIQKSEELGIKHSFRFFAGKDFLPPIFLSGKQFAFASHVLDRFRERVTSGSSRNIGELLWLLFSSSANIALRPNGNGEAIVKPDFRLVFPYEESANEYLFMTCLTDNEVRYLSPVEPPRRLYFHYGQTFTPPTTPLTSTEAIRQHAQYRIDKWNNHEKTKYEDLSLSTEAEKVKACSQTLKAKLWNRIAKQAENESKNDWPSGGKWKFAEGIYGPSMRPHAD
jgi:hypothetical protein